MESRYLAQADTALPQPAQTSEQDTQDASVQLSSVGLVDISDSPALGVCTVDGECS